MFGSIGSAVVRRVARAALVVAAGLVLTLTANVSASAETRSLKIYHVHLREKTEIVYKRNGRFLPDGLKKLNWALRDWRESKPTNMDPALFDILWETYRQSGSRQYINVIGGYRSPTTNKKLRSRSSGVAEKSLHTQGKAIDFFLPDVPLRKIRDIGLKMQVGGVGYYPRSGSPFVHFDTGKGRHWPRLSRKELVAVFPNGNTIHVPSDGKPLPGYETALASYNKRRSSETIQIANASESRSGGGRSLLAAIFGGGAEEAEDEAEAATPVPARREERRQAPEPQVQVAAAEPARRAPTPPAALPTGVPMPERNVFDTSGRAPTPPAEVPAAAPAPTAVAALDLARIPMPTAAPGRIAAPKAEQPAQTVESALVAALEAPAPAPSASGQLAYAVPMPSQRPPFEAVLSGQANAGAQPEAPASAVAALESVPVPTPPAAEPLQVASLAAPVPALRPSVEAAPATTVEAAPATTVEDAIAALAQDMAASEPTVESLAAEAVKTAAIAEPADLIAASAPTATEVPASAGLSGKSGRVLQAKAEPAEAAGATPAPQQAIASRIEIATLVTSPDRRAEEARLVRPNAEMLVVDVPVSVMASGFAPRTSVGASDRFSGSAVNFLPVRKLD